jgi:ornithine cyclodeaminase
MIKYIDIHALQSFLMRHSVEKAIADIEAYIKADYLRWDQFDKCPRIAHHCHHGVIELMPISDGRLYSFKYVN